MKLMQPILAALSSLSVVRAVSFGSALYDQTDPLLILDNTNFNQILRSHAPKPYLIQFYNSWCGHCIRYSPTFKEFANDVIAWQPAVDVGVVNCADKINSDLCRDQQISAFPTIKLFWIEKNGAGSTAGTEVQSRELPALRKEVIDFIQTKVKTSAPYNYPKLEALQVTTVKEIWDLIPLDVRQVFAIVEDENVYIGRETILDFSGVTTAKVVRFIRGTGPEELKNRDSVTLLSLEKGIHPRVIISLKNGPTARDQVKTALRKLGYLNEGKAAKTPKPVIHNQIGDPSKIYVDDIEAGLTYTLYQEVKLHQLNTDRQTVLAKFLKALIDNVKMPENVKKYLENVHKSVVAATTISAEDYENILKKSNTSDGYLRDNVDFKGCKGSIVGKRGYTCSLWTIAHLMTVGAHSRYLKNEISNPGDVLLTFRDYVQTFFSCRECVEHFKGMAANLESKLSAPEQSALWLWDAHNQVNARLKGDATEDPERPKVAFPPKSLCAECRETDDKFKQPEVLKFLHRFYNETNYVQPSSDTTSYSPQPEAYKKQDDTTYGPLKLFSGFDLTILLVIYAGSITLLFVVFVAIVCRRKKSTLNKPVFHLH